jgi:hypothetical protein
VGEVAEAESGAVISSVTTSMIGEIVAAETVVP